jgi:hypothetical protein
MTDRKLLLDRHRKSLDESVEQAPLDYIQLRNMEALREWRIKWAFVSGQPSDACRTRQSVGA